MRARCGSERSGRAWRGGVIVLLAALGLGSGVVAAGQPTAPAPAPAERPTAVLSRGDAAFDAARARFAQALGIKPAPRQPGTGERLLVLDGDLPARLIERRWQAPGKGGDPAERVRTMVGLARVLRLPTAVGIMQALFGTPAENGLVEPQRALAEARAVLSHRPKDRGLIQLRDERQQALDAALGRLPAFRNKGRDWALADLDADRDGAVTGKDLSALEGKRRNVASSGGNVPSAGSAATSRE
jgi:hypothetical protein